MSTVFDNLSLPGMFIALIVLVSLCLVLGVIYTYIYCRYMKPKPKSRRYAESMGDEKKDDNKLPKYTHMFLFRKR